LRQMLDQVPPGQRLPIAGILRMFDALCAALDYAHRFTVHRDIKPENVMILENGAVKLMDFGISKLMGNPNLTSASIVMGTPHYMAPEQMKNTAMVDARADLYSVGVMLYEVLTGDRPTGLAKPASKIHGEVPAALDPIIEKCCQVDPAKRYRNAEELRAALRTVRVAVEKKTDPSGRTPPAASRGRRSQSLPIARVAGGTLALVAIAAGAFAGVRWAEERRRELVSAAPVGIAALPASGQSAVSPADDFRALSAEIPKLQRGAEQAAEKYSAAQREWLIDPLVALGGELWAAAGEAVATEPARALELGWDATACYLAPVLWPEGMVFVPPAPPGAVPRHAGFFVDARPVSAAAFAEFRQSSSWRLPPAASTAVDEAPISGVALFDALAFAASAKPLRRLPTRDEYDYTIAALDSEEQRVFAMGNEPAPDSVIEESDSGDDGEVDTADQAAPERTAMPWLLFPGADVEGWGEWTTTGTDSAIDVAEATFRDSFWTWGGHWSDEGDFMVDDPVPANFESAEAAVGFRTVLDLPRDLAALNRVR